MGCPSIERKFEVPSDVGCRASDCKLVLWPCVAGLAFSSVVCVGIYYWICRNGSTRIHHRFTIFSQCMLQGHTSNALASFANLSTLFLIPHPPCALPPSLQMLTVHYYLLFDGTDDLWQHIETFYKPDATLM